MSTPNTPSFNFNGLPTELKTKILEHNICDYDTYFKVSRQVRNITVGLSFRDVVQLTWAHPSDLRRDVIKTSKKSLMAVPIASFDNQSFTLYARFPTQHPHLSPYATFKHAIRKATLAFDFRTYIHFFKINSSGWLTDPERGLLTRPERALVNVDHLTTQLSSLKHLTIILPPYRPVVSDKSRDHFRIFDALDPCYRALHREIYTAIANSLTSIPDVIVKGFIDANEEATYLRLREAALNKAIKLTPEDLDELYADDNGGGIQLSPVEAFVDTRHMPRVWKNWKAPRCVCEVPCAPIFQGLTERECEDFVRRHEDMAVKDRARKAAAKEARKIKEAEEAAALQAAMAAQAAAVGFDEVL
ncbi:hypothetical protein DM02DRAFT_624524 [Periconia macrospinosa]|uniref:Uncharacterized protein n=1 Tax=Periconia macrospinosa TaxID=97972 RepID=A0A2V1E4G7_9PLEO|nr:hypothetical protein DM02DRAFT_624524 [Periconia macrospinosa]